MRIAAWFSYNGEPFSGFARQNGQLTVQGNIEDALELLFRRRIDTTCAGRTDAGVHALCQVISFDLLPDEWFRRKPDSLLKSLNALTHEEISFRSVRPMPEDFSARFSAVMREYRYYIEPRKNPFTRGTTWQYYVPLDVGRMNEAAAWLLCYDDFTSFAKLNSNNKTNICRVMHASWTADGQGVLCFTIRADRFLRNMVRSLVGTLVDVGRGRYTPQQFREIVESRDLSRSSGGAPAQGLFLSDVVYPADVFERKVFY